MVKIATQFINIFSVYQCCKICYIHMAIFTTLHGEIHNSIQHKLHNSMEVDGMGIIAVLSMSYITTRIVKTQTSVAKIPRVPVENQIITLSVVKIAIKFSPCRNVQQHLIILIIVYSLSFLYFKCVNIRSTSVTNFQKHNTCAPTSPLV